MIVFDKTRDINDFVKNNSKQGLITGFIPTMGALHHGHISLLAAAKKTTSITVCSVFVNPTQFNDSSDFENYPSTVESDIEELEKAGCDVLFLPSVAEMYPGGIKKVKEYDLGYLETVLEGKFRPGHFQGVCQVVHRLLDIIPADQLFIGQKDYQQCMVIKKLVELLKIKTSIIICPTLREKDGLAMSSRNVRLTEPDRIKALKIFKTLSFLKNNLHPGKLKELQETAKANLTRAGFKVDYVALANAKTLEPVTEWDGNTALVALIAAFLHNVRLIDNMLL